MSQLADIVEELSLWSTGCGVILTSENSDHFCSGGDLTTVREITDPYKGFLMATLMHDTLTKLGSLPLVSVCLVNGPAIGGGAELITATDFRLFTQSGEARFVQGRMGLSPGWGGGTRLVDIIGSKHALDILLTGRKITADDALRVGLSDATVDDNESYAQTIAWLNKRTQARPEVVHVMKKLVAFRKKSLLDSLHNERLLFSTLWGGPANIEALSQNIKH